MTITLAQPNNVTQKKVVFTLKLFVMMKISVPMMTAALQEDAPIPLLTVMIILLVLAIIA